MDWGGLGEVIGAGLAAVAILLGKVYGPRAEQRFFGTVGLVVGGSFVALLAAGLVWWAIASGGEDQQASAKETAAAMEFCGEFDAAGAEFDSALGADLLGPTDGSVDLAATTAMFDELAEKAPPEIKDDVTTLASAWAGLSVVMKDNVVLNELDLVVKEIDFSNPSATSAETLAKLGKLNAKLHAPAVQQAEQAATNLSAWSDEHCGTSILTTP